MKKIKNFLIEFFDNLSKTQKIICALFFLVIMMFLVNLISNVSFKDTFIDYKNITGESMIENKSLVTDRNVYLILDNIIDNFINTYNGNFYIDDKKVKLKDFYDNALYNEFKYNMSYSKFKNKVRDLYNKLAMNEEPSDQKIMAENNIECIYLFSEPRNMYLVKLKSKSNESAFIGIELDNNLGKYTIFYLE